MIIGCEKNVSDPDFKTIMIKSTGEIAALPDQASFHVSLYCMDLSVKDSKNCLVTKSNDLIARLQALGVEKKDITTTSVDLSKSYTWRNNSSVFEGYRSSTSLIVTVKKIEKLDEIYTELLENQNLEMSSLSYGHSDIDSLQNEAYIKALKKSERLADKLLTTLPEKNKEILKIGNVEIESSMPKGRQIADGVATEQTAVVNQSIGMSSGVAKISATLFVEYQIN